MNTISSTLVKERAKNRKGWLPWGIPCLFQVLYCLAMIPNGACAVQLSVFKSR